MSIEEKDMIVGNYYVGSWHGGRIIIQFASTDLRRATHVIDAANNYTFTTYGHSDISWREATQGERETLIAAIEVAARNKIINAERKYRQQQLLKESSSLYNHFNYLP